MTRTQLQEAVEACRDADEACLAEILGGLGYLQPRRSATNLVLLAENPDLAGLLDLIIVDALESASSTPLKCAGGYSSFWGRLPFWPAFSVATATTCAAFWWKTTFCAVKAAAR
jgi:hypothetical protein